MKLPASFAVFSGDEGFSRNIERAVDPIIDVCAAIVARIRNLLANARTGEARITLKGHHPEEFAVERVTTEFVTIRRGSFCQNVEPAAIDKIAWKPTEDPYRFHPFASIIDQTDYGSMFVPIWLVALYPVLIPVDNWRNYRAAHEDVSGSWVSIHQAPGEDLHRIRFEHLTRFAATAYVYEEFASVRTGRYTLQPDRTLNLLFDDGEARRLHGIRFECNSLMYESDFPVRLRAGERIELRAYPPIVGRWTAADRNGNFVWEFRADGSFHLERVTPIYSGTYVKSGSSLTLNTRNGRPEAPLRPTGEKLQYRISSGHLFITTKNKTVEYEHGMRILD